MTHNPSFKFRSRGEIEEKKEEKKKKKSRITASMFVAMGDSSGEMKKRKEEGSAPIRMLWSANGSRIKKRGKGKKKGFCSIENVDTLVVYDQSCWRERQEKGKEKRGEEREGTPPCFAHDEVRCQLLRDSEKEGTEEGGGRRGRKEREKEL